MTRKLREVLKLANKIYLNSYECMWNDAMTHSLKNNFFYFYNPNTIEKITETSQNYARNLSKYNNLEDK